MKFTSKTSHINAIAVDGNSIFLSGLVTTIHKVSCIKNVCAAKNEQEFFAITSNIHVDLACIDIDMFNAGAKFVIEKLKAKTYTVKYYCSVHALKEICFAYCSKQEQMDLFQSVYQL